MHDVDLEFGRSIPKMYEGYTNTYFEMIQCEPAHHTSARNSLTDIDISWSAMLLALPKPVDVVAGEVLTCRSHAI